MQKLLYTLTLVILVFSCSKKEITPPISESMKTKTYSDMNLFSLEVGDQFTYIHYDYFDDEIFTNDTLILKVESRNTDTLYIQEHYIFYGNGNGSAGVVTFDSIFSSKWIYHNDSIEIIRLHEITPASTGFQLINARVLHRNYKYDRHYVLNDVGRYRPDCDCYFKYKLLYTLDGFMTRAVDFVLEQGDTLVVDYLDLHSRVPETFGYLVYSFDQGIFMSQHGNYSPSDILHGWVRLKTSTNNYKDRHCPLPDNPFPDLSGFHSAN